MNRGTPPRMPPHPRAARFGSILDVFDPVTDVFTSIVTRIPGSSWVQGVFAQGGTWIKDLANFSVTEGGTTIPIGYLVLTIASGGAFQGLAPVVGPQVASVVWTVPDLIQGNTTFTQAYAKEFLNRLTALIQYFLKQNGGNADAAAAAANQQVTQALTALSTNPAFQSVFQSALAQIKQLRDGGLDAQAALAQLHLTPQDIAAKFGVREDVAAMAIDAAMHEFVYDFSAPQNDPATGKLPVTPLPLSALLVSANAAVKPITAPETGTADELLTQLLQLQNNAPGDLILINRLQQAYVAQKAVEDAQRAATAPLPPGAVRIAPWQPLSVAMGPSLPATAAAPPTPSPAPSFLSGVLTLALFTSPLWIALVVRHLRRHP